MDMNKLRNKSVSVILGGGIIGVFIFLLIYGWEVIDFTNDGWLFSGEDISQHYFGWLYYRMSDIKWPLGIIDNMVDLNISIIFMDSIPLLALILKFFNELLPETFQYFGLWGVFSYGMMGAIASYIIYIFSKNCIIGWLGSVFFITSPYMLQRMFSHTSLAGQWVILLAITIWVFNIGKENIYKKTIIWTSMLAMVALIHLYFIPMIFVLCFVDMLRFCIIRKNVYGIVISIIPVVITLLELYMLGAFSESSEYVAWGLGYYSANINVLINSMNMTSILPAFPFGEGQYEGFGYLGLGILILLVIDLIVILKNKEEFVKEIKQHSISVVCTGIILIVFFILSLSPTVMLGSEILFTIHWPEIIMKILRIFRASGRFIWCVSYLVMVFTFIVLCKWCKKKNIIIAISICCCIQIVDIMPLIETKKTQISTNMEIQNLIDDDLLKIVLKDKEKIVFTPYNCVYNNSKMTYALALYCYKNNLEMNSFYVSRLDSSIMQDLDAQYKNQILSKEAEQYAYVFYSKEDFFEDEYHLFYYQIGDIMIGVTSEILELEDLRIA